MSENELVHDPRSTELTIGADQAGFTDVQLSVLRQLGVEDAPEGDIQLFFHQAKRTGLDPFHKQIYMIGRRTNIKRFDEDSRQWVDNWQTVYTIQTGIDGYRVLGHRTARNRGDEVEVKAPLWRGRTTGWDDVWLGAADNPPAAAKVCIVVNGQSYVATAMYAEYVQTSGRGDNEKPNKMWRKMPANQLAKCAEAAAWRLAYPSDFSGMVLEDAVQVIDEHGDVVETATRTRVETARGGGGLRARLEAKKAKAGAESVTVDAETPAAEPETPAVVDVELEPDAAPAAEGKPGRSTKAALLDELADALDAAKIGSDAERGAFLSERVGRELTGFDDMRIAEIRNVLEYLAAGNVQGGDVAPAADK